MELFILVVVLIVSMMSVDWCSFRKKKQIKEVDELAEIQ